MAEKRTVQELNEMIDEAVAHWNDVYENGCSDPFWPDGCNLNLIRNHVIYYLKQLEEVQKQPIQLSFFEEIGQGTDPTADRRIPMKVPHSYMAKDRVVIGELLRASDRGLQFD